MCALGIGHLDSEVVDWIQFCDIIVELYGDPFFEKRFRQVLRAQLLCAEIIPP